MTDFVIGKFADIDTLECRLGVWEMGQVNFYLYILPSLSYDGNYTDRAGNVHEKRKFGQWVKLDYSSTGIKITIVSIAQYLGNPLAVVTPPVVKQVIEELSNILQLSISEAIVTRVDYGYNFLVNNPTLDYCTYLGRLGRLKRQEEDNGLMYIYGKGKGKNKKKRKSRGVWGFAIYDKIENCEDKDKFVPESYKGRNVLRMEAKVFKPKEYFKAKYDYGEIKCSTLYDEDFIRHITERLKTTYFRIEKINILKPMEKIDGSKFRKKVDFSQVAVLFWVKGIGGELAAREYLENLRKAGKINSIQKKRRLEEVEAACKLEPLTERSGLIDELDGKVKQLGEDRK